MYPMGNTHGASAPGSWVPPYLLCTSVALEHGALSDGIWMNDMNDNDAIPYVGSPIGDPDNKTGSQ